MAWCQQQVGTPKSVLEAQSSQLSPTIPALTDANPELVRLVIDDQWDRGNDMFGKGQVRDPSTLDGKTVGEHDAERRKAVHGMLAKGEIKTASDYYFSALIFQHSSDSQGFILAHVLSMTAAAKGNEAARYMAAATMDRYLHSINQPQIFGTQFFHGADNSWTMDPYDRNAISDSERAIWCVAPLSQQNVILAKYNTRGSAGTQLQGCK